MFSFSSGKRDISSSDWIPHKLKVATFLQYNAVAIVLARRRIVHIITKEDTKKMEVSAQVCTCSTKHYLKRILECYRKAVGTLSYSNSIIDIYEDHLGDVCSVSEERNDNDLSDKAVLCAVLVMSINREASRKLANDVLKFLHSTRISASVYWIHVPTMEKFKAAVHKRTTDRFLGLKLSPIAILRTGNTAQE